MWPLGRMWPSYTYNDTQQQLQIPRENIPIDIYYILKQLDVYLFICMSTTIIPRFSRKLSIGQGKVLGYWVGTEGSGILPPLKKIRAPQVFKIRYM